MTILDTEETLESRKRPRAESTEKSKNEHEEKLTPEYGSQEYWEKRYENMAGEQAEEKPEDDPEPYHAWYFKFEDLAPILLPLIIGSDDYEDSEDGEDDDNGSDPNEEDEADGKIERDVPDHKEGGSTVETLPQTIDTPTSNKDQTNNTENAKSDEAETQNKNSEEDEIDTRNENDEECNDVESDEEIEGFEVVEMDDEDEDANSVTARAGLAKNCPISVLEVGCGDAPLGHDLALSVLEYGSENKRDPSGIIQKIVCLDYSKNVIQTMKQEQEQQQLQNKKKGIQLIYEAGDARDLSYENESFEVILEKGTLDAMLSDSDGLGQTNCRKIVSECARVLTIGGYIVIISHLNAHVESGLEWLNNIIVPGLRAAGKFEWLIEVHGSDIEIPSEDEAEENNEKQIESPGPAVYFIEKVGVLAQQKVETSNDSNQPSIPLKFFSY